MRRCWRAYKLGANKVFGRFIHKAHNRYLKLKLDIWSAITDNRLVSSILLLENRFKPALASGLFFRKNLLPPILFRVHRWQNIPTGFSIALLLIFAIEPKLRRSGRIVFCLLRDPIRARLHQFSSFSRKRTGLPGRLWHWPRFHASLRLQHRPRRRLSAQWRRR